MSRRRVLVIGDEDDIREVTAMTLEEVGNYDVTTATGGAAGCEQARLNPPDLMAGVLDSMPSGNTAEERRS